MDLTDINVSDYRMFKRLVDAHVYPNLINKNEGAKRCASVFSEGVCSNETICKRWFVKNQIKPIVLYYPTSTRRHGNFAGVHTILRILLSSNSAVLINIITGVLPPHFDFVVYYVLCQC
jgi:hypothetical protein